MLKKISIYWWCQILGWLVNIAISIFFVNTFGTPTSKYYFSLITSCLIGVLITHIMRNSIHKMKVLEKSISRQIIFLLILTIVYAFIFGIAAEFFDYLIGYNPERLEKFTRSERIFLGSFNAMWLILVWNMIYFMYHYVETGRKQKLDTIRLESMVKSLELQTIKSHINPHFIFNALNSIRALVDENPQRARKAITELSNILRSSMQTEKLETVPLERELNIVKDYLALEQMRFEERLSVKMEIEEDTLYLPVPPMMLQTLVENAIKHGISKQISGGVIEIQSTLHQNTHELVVRNSGKLNGYNPENENGFGIRSTHERLNLLFQGKAGFKINETPAGMVETIITIPVFNP